MNFKRITALLAALALCIPAALPVHAAEQENKAYTPYEDRYGLGWDIVGYEDYDNAGVQIVSKGGDVTGQHADLLVAPEEEISVAVLSSGGSSMYNELMSMAFMDIALEEKGITVEHPGVQEMETLDSVPEEYLSYAYLYITADGVYDVSFPGGNYMEITRLTGVKPEMSQYLCTTGGSFVKMDGKIGSGNAVQSKNQELLHFGKRGGKDYILSDSYMDMGRTGSYRLQNYFLQRAGHQEVSEDAQAAWHARNGKRYHLYSTKYSNVYYGESPSIRVQTYENARGFVNGETIVDADHAVSMFQYL